jgi:hypothetical protein
MLADLLLYVWLLLEHWTAFVTGSVVTAVFYLFERLAARPVRLRTVVVVFVLFGFAIASYQTWHDQYEQQTYKAALRAEHIAQLQKFWIEGGDLLKEDVTKDNFDKWLDKANVWVDRTAKWVDGNMGAAARERFLDKSGMLAMSYSRALNQQHNTAIQNITRFLDNLRYLMDNESWDRH